MFCGFSPLLFKSQPFLLGPRFRLLRRALSCLLSLLRRFLCLLLGQLTLPVNLALFGYLRIMLGLLLSSLCCPLLFLHQP